MRSFIVAVLALLILGWGVFPRHSSKPPSPDRRSLKRSARSRNSLLRCAMDRPRSASFADPQANVLSRLL